MAAGFGKPPVSGRRARYVCFWRDSGFRNVRISASLSNGSCTDGALIGRFESVAMVFVDGGIDGIGRNWKSVSSVGHGSIS